MPIDQVISPLDGGGTVTGASNVGGEEEVFKQLNGDTLEFRTLVGVNGTTIVTNGDTLEIDGAAGAGDITNASNVGGGTFEVFAQKNVATLEFKTFDVGTNGFEVSELADLFTFDLQQDLKDTASPLFANLNIRDNGAIRTGLIAADTVFFQAFDVDGAVFETFATLTAGNTPSFSFHGTMDGNITGAGWGFLTLGDIEIGDTNKIKTLTGGGSQYFLTAHDVDGAVDVNFITFTADNIPTCDLSDSVTKAGAYIYRAGGTDIPLADGGLGVSLADPNADRMLFWDDSAASIAFLAFGNSLNITGTTIDTIQDIQTTASPTFANLNLTTGGALRTGTSAGNTTLLQARDVDGAAWTTFATLTANNTPTFDIDIAATVGSRPIAQSFTPYTPTLTNVTNVAASSTSDFGYCRIGRYVFGGGRITIDPTAGAVATELGVSIPIASNFSLFTQCTGGAISSASAGLCAAVRADTTNDRIQIVYTNTTELASKEFMIWFFYEVI